MNSPDVFQLWLFYISLAKAWLTPWLVALPIFSGVVALIGRGSNKSGLQFVMGETVDKHLNTAIDAAWRAADNWFGKRLISLQSVAVSVATSAVVALVCYLLAVLT